MVAWTREAEALVEYRSCSLAPALVGSSVLGKTTQKGHLFGNQRFVDKRAEPVSAALLSRYLGARHRRVVALAKDSEQKNRQQQLT